MDRKLAAADRLASAAATVIAGIDFTGHPLDMGLSPDDACVTALRDALKAYRDTPTEEQRARILGDMQQVITTIATDAATVCAHTRKATSDDHGVTTIRCLDCGAEVSVPTANIGRGELRFT